MWWKIFIGLFVLWLLANLIYARVKNRQFDKNVEQALKIRNEAIERQKAKNSQGL